MSGHWAIVLVRLPRIQNSNYYILPIACPLGALCGLFCTRTFRLFTMGLSQLFLVHIWGCGSQTNTAYSLLFSKPPSVFLPDYESLKNLCTLLQGQILLHLFLASIFSSLVSTMVKLVPVPGVSYAMYCSLPVWLSFFVYWASVR